MECLRSWYRLNILEDISKLANLFRIYRTCKAYTSDKVPLHLSHSEHKGVKTGSIRF